MNRSAWLTILCLYSQGLGGVVLALSFGLLPSNFLTGALFLASYALLAFLMLVANEAD